MEGAKNLYFWLIFVFFFLTILAADRRLHNGKTNRNDVKSLKDMNANNAASKIGEEKDESKIQNTKYIDILYKILFKICIILGIFSLFTILTFPNE
jgi:cytochrome b subunit of formate dehydrogenase